MGNSVRDELKDKINYELFNTGTGFDVDVYYLVDIVFDVLEVPEIIQDTNYEQWVATKKRLENLMKEDGK